MTITTSAAKQNFAALALCGTLKAKVASAGKRLLDIVKKREKIAANGNKERGPEDRVTNTNKG